MSVPLDPTALRRLADDRAGALARQADQDARSLRPSHPPLADAAEQLAQSARLLQSLLADNPNPPPTPPSR